MSSTPPRPRRDRHGRGMRGVMARGSVPLARTRAEEFDEIVLRCVERLTVRSPDRLGAVEFAVEDVPVSTPEAASDDDILTDGAVPLSRLFRQGLPGIDAPCVVLYRRPLEARAKRREELTDLVNEVVVEQAARLLGVDPDELDPPLD
jgi:predicted Zn-dependent protease with MMP-like domain